MRIYSMVKRTFNPLVAGPNPARPTNKTKGLQALRLVAPFSYLAESGRILPFLRPLCTHFLIIFFFLLSCGVAHAGEWTRADTYREVAYLALHVADWGTTLDIADHPEKWREYNPILGRHPSRGEVNAYFIATGLLHPVVSYGLKKYAPPGWSEAFQYITVGIEAGAVANNLSVGIGFGF